MRARRTAFAAVLGSLLLVCGAPPRAALAKGPGDPGTKRLVEAWFAADAKGRDAATATLAEVSLTAEEAEAWRKPILALAAKRGPRLAKKSGRAFLYEDPEKGLYLLANEGARGGLLVALHGGGAGAGDASSAASAFSGPASSLKMAMVAPEVLVKTEHGWTDPPETERFVLDLIDAAKRSLKVDPNRVYLTGHSMGGYGTWTLGAVHADVFGGLAAFAGAPTCTRTGKDAPLSGVEEGVLPNLRNVPLWVYQSLDDRNVPPESNEFAVPLLAALAKDDPGGYLHHYERVDGRGHGPPEKGYVPALEWATKRPRDPRPKKVVWQPSRPWKRQFYWLWWDAPALGATVTVETKERNVFEVSSTDPLDGLRLLLDARLADLGKEVVVRVNGKETHRTLPRFSLATMVRTAERVDADLLFAADVPVLAPAAK
jgi:poly(3-hydroxybutyrate) depolymerase